MDDVFGAKEPRLRYSEWARTGSGPSSRALRETGISRLKSGFPVPSPVHPELGERPVLAARVVGAGRARSEDL